MAANESAIVLVDELEHGLEPHRITRLLGSLGAKEGAPPLQAFVTTHSPAAIRELQASQLHVVRSEGSEHCVQIVPTTDDTQGTIRLYPEAMLAPIVVVCEGASEVGLLRGLDQYRWMVTNPSLAAMGVALVDGNGIAQIFKRAEVFQSLGYRTAVLRDDDVKPPPALEETFIGKAGKVTAWREGLTLEDELFLSLSDNAVSELLAVALDLHGDELVDSNIKSASTGTLSLADCQAGITPEVRTILGKASRTKKAGWYKSVTWMEQVSRDIVGPDLTSCDPAFARAICDIFRWMENGGA
jgi:hypothetical protein